jgi:Sec-independent protein translocase protein TatA
MGDYYDKGFGGWEWIIIIMLLIIIFCPDIFGPKRYIDKC